ncbi:MAG TPA: pilus assembly PilX N-terminal domain-containing protein [Candidatus Acidoferrales bacterium]|jgi:hypothetical protein|nr:pilus assembly PilX N-terminal domain-containing protein [Candidatus Acidoferrales bacterium]
MKMKRTTRRMRRPTESGAAMLIAIFALLLISVVAIALVVSTGTDSSLAGNYRTATTAYYAGVAGLEEARGRLLWKNPDYINISGSYSSLLSSSGVPTWGLTQVMYITNPASGETVDPTSSNPAYYPDTEYIQEFSFGLPGAAVQQIASVSPLTSASLPGPSYKWVRINAVTEKALNIDVNGDGVKDGASVLFYDPAHVNPSNQAAPSLVVPPGPSSPPVAPTPTAVQALEITALAVAPNGGQRLLQYVVAPLIISPDTQDQNFPAALTLDGNGVIYQAPGTSAFKINGVDTCNPPAPPALPGSVPSIGASNATDTASALAEVNSPLADAQYYPGAPLSSTPPPYTPTTPSVSNLNVGYPSSTLRQSWLTPASLDAVMQDIENSADLVLTGAATGADISAKAPLMSASNPMTIVVNGNLNLSGWHNSGYGLLLVTGTLYYDPDASWNGIVLVVGQGIFSSSKNGTGGFNGAVFVAQTRDSGGNLLSGTSLGPAFFGSQTSYGSTPGFGINYSSCMVQSAQGPLTYKVLSFHEIPLN